MDMPADADKIETWNTFWPKTYFLDAASVDRANPVDPDRVVNANLKGDGWRRAHDTVLAVIARTAQELGVSVRKEVHSLFSTLPEISFHERAEEEMRPRNRQGCVPDAVVRCPAGADNGEEMLLELKLMRFNAGNYMYSVPEER